jgi:hypothetical protein
MKFNEWMAHRNIPPGMSLISHVSSTAGSYRTLGYKTERGIEITIQRRVNLFFWVTAGVYNKRNA